MRRIVVFVLLAAIAAIVLGFIVSPDGFLGNLLAELVGILVGVALALTIAEQLAQRRHREQWARVRRQTLRSLCGYIESIAFDFAMSLPDQPLDVRTNAHWIDYPSAAEVEAARKGLRDLEDLLARDADGMADSEDLDAGSSKALFEETDHNLLAIRDVLAPRILTLDEDPDLSRLLGDLEEAERRWQMVIPAIEDWGISHKDGWAEAKNVLHRARLVYDHAAIRLLGIEE
jgi:hypothetical protein